MNREKKRQKDFKIVSKTLEDVFAERKRGQELIPVVLQRSDWEALQYSIKLALKKK